MLTSLILKLTVPGFGGELLPRARVRCGIVSGVTGIVCNVLLILIKIVLAVATGSIAIAAEAVNNLSDAGAGVITIAGFHLAAQPPDAEHPFGHGRTEYVAGLIVALLVMVLGVNFLKDSITALVQPSSVKATPLTIAILGSTMLIKCWMFFFYSRVSTLINSSVVKAAAWDSLSDCLGTLIVTGSLIASCYTSFPVDGCAGTVVALMILWAGWGILKETISKLLGESPDLELVKKIKNTILSAPGIDGVHDIIVHNYGENSHFVTAHAEISCEGDRTSAHDLLENAEVLVARKHSVHLLLHGDPHDKNHPEIIYWRSRLENAVALFNSEMKVYDFKLIRESDQKVSGLDFHLLIPHNLPLDDSLLKEQLQEKMRSFSKNIVLEIRFIRSFV